MSKELQIHNDKANENILDKIETRLPPIDIPTVSSLSVGAFDTHQRGSSSLCTSEENRILNKIETQLTSSGTPKRPSAPVEDLDTHSGVHSISSSSEEHLSLNKNKTLLPPTGLLVRPISPQDFNPHSNNHLISSKLEKGRILIPEKQNVEKKIPSNVRKMISAFESSKAKVIFTY